MFIEALGMNKNSLVARALLRFLLLWLCGRVNATECLEPHCLQSGLWDIVLEVRPYSHKQHE